MTNDEDEESEDAFVHTLEDYVPTDDERNDETKDHNDEEKGDADMTDAAHVQVKQTQEQTTDVQEESGQEMESIQGQYVVQATTTTTPSIYNATIEKDVKELKSVDNSTIVISTIKSKVLNVVKEYLESSLDDALYKVIQKHSADIIKEHFVLAEIVERLKQQYAPQKKY
ncbi:hypothetical protein Tco_1443099 [Tanacetum coccineum]